MSNTQTEQTGFWETVAKRGNQGFYVGNAVGLIGGVFVGATGGSLVSVVAAPVLIPVGFVGGAMIFDNAVGYRAYRAILDTPNDPKDAFGSTNIQAWGTRILAGWLGGSIGASAVASAPTTTGIIIGGFTGASLGAAFGYGAGAVVGAAEYAVKASYDTAQAASKTMLGNLSSDVPKIVLGKPIAFTPAH